MGLIIFNYRIFSSIARKFLPCQGEFVIVMRSK